MRIAELLCADGIALHQTMADYDDAIHALVGLAAKSDCLYDAADFEQCVLERERQGSTCVGGGIAIPHAKSDAVRSVGLAALTFSPPGLGCDSPDGKAVELMFLIAAPAENDNGAMLHIQVLAQLAGLLMDHAFAQKLSAAETPEAFLELIAAQEELHETSAAQSADPLPDASAPPAMTQELQKIEAPPPTPRILAVTACPAGLAHTYLAAAALKVAGEKRGLSIKVETNGASGVQDELTPAEIAAADAIIVATGKSVPMKRFIGKPVLEVGVGAAVRDADGLVDKALAGNLPQYVGKSNRGLRQWLRVLVPDFYKHLMNGISHMLPFVTGGGLLVALSLLLRQMGAPESVYNVFYNVGSTALDLMYVALAGYIASSIGGLPAFMPGALGGYMAATGMSVTAQELWVSSGFWGALLAGGVAGLTIRWLTKLCRGIPQDLDHLKTTLIYPVVGLAVVGVAMLVVINQPMGAFNSWLHGHFTNLHGGSRLLLCMMLAALMASDYGGPINKAAYLSGTVALVGGQYDIMAAVMIGGMVPPIGVALACLAFPRKFTKGERRLVPQALLLGASFVTEGALPYALKDPFRVIPAAMFGSGVAGLLCAVFGCGCPAPHGGLFLLPMLNNPVQFIVALFAGSAAMAAVLGVVKKPALPEPPPKTES